MKYTSALKIHKNWLLRKIPWTDLFEVQESFIFYLDHKNKQGKITIPKGFKTNFWSIPRLFRPFLNRTKYIAYILHDYLWSKKAVIRFWKESIAPAFKQSNEILKEAMEVEWSNIIERNLVYLWLQYSWFPYYHYLNCIK